MRSLITVLVVGLSVFGSAGCGDNEIDYPIGDGGWLVDLTVESVDPVVPDLPIEIALQAWVVDLTNGATPPTGSVVVFTASGGAFTNGLAEISIQPVEGKAAALLTVPLPGRYEVTATYPDGEASSTVVIPVGFE